MKQTMMTLILLSLTFFFCASDASAIGESYDQACIAVHVGPAVAKAHCDNAPDLVVDTIDTSVIGCGGPDTYTVWILVCGVFDSLGVAGLEYGILYDGAEQSGVDVTAWWSCTDLEFPQADWPASASGNLQTWDYTANCQNTLVSPYSRNDVIAIAGALDVAVYGQDHFSITPRPVSGRVKLGDCFGMEYDLTGLLPSHLGVAAFCDPGTGYNPCQTPGLPIAIRPSTWGKIKSQY